MNTTQALFERVRSLISQNIVTIFIIGLILILGRGFGLLVATKSSMLSMALMYTQVCLIFILVDIKIA